MTLFHHAQVCFLSALNRVTVENSKVDAIFYAWKVWVRHETDDAFGYYFFGRIAINLNHESIFLHVTLIELSGKSYKFEFDDKHVQPRSRDMHLKILASFR